MTNYVMVPVPAEHAKELGAHLMRMSLIDLMSAWDAESIAGALEALSPEQRVLVDFVAKGVVEGRQLPLSEVAERVQTSESMVQRMVRQVNLVCGSLSLPDLMLFDPLPKTLPSGETVRQNLLAIGREAAGMVVGAASVAGEPPA